MAEGEYDQYNVEQLYALIQDDQPDKLDDYAQAWANAAEVFKTELESLEKHFDAIQGSWSSGAAELYLAQIHRAMSAVHQAHFESNRRSESASKVAADVRQANEGVETAYNEWLTEKNTLKAKGSPLEEFLKDVNPWAEDQDETDAERRKPFDETARKYLNNAAINHQNSIPTVTTPVQPYKPVDVQSPNTGEWDGPDLSNIDLSQQGVASYGADSAATATASSAGPSLQSGVSVPSSSVAPSVPSPSAGPGVSGPGVSASVPVGPGGVPVSRGVTPPVPGRSGSGSGQGPGRAPGSGRAPRTPSLPGRNGQASGSRPSGMNSRPGTSNRPGTSGRPGSSSRPGTTGRNNTTGRNGTAGRNGTNGRNNTTGRNASTTRNGTGRNGAAGRNGVGRGRQVSRLAPADRTGRVRASGEVLGQRKPATKPTTTGRNGTGRGPVRRKVQPAVIGRAGKKNPGTTTGTRRQRRDNTSHGYTSHVIGQRHTQTEPDYTHTPVVANTIHDAGKVFGARPQADTLESARQRRMRNRRRTTTSPTGVTRPVIGNGITNPHQIHHTPPATASQPHHQADRALWQQTTTPTPPVIGTRTPPPTHHHNPGPELKPQPHKNHQDQDQDGDSRHRHDPGPTAFTTPPATPTWPTTQ